MNLKSFREDKLKIKSVAEFAKLLEVDPEKLTEWESDPNICPFQIVQKIMEKTGVELKELAGWEKPVVKPLDVKDVWKNVNFTKSTIADYISSTLNEIGLSDEYRGKYVDALKNGITEISVKPKIAIVGRSDTGKSTMINKLLGVDKMPTSWTPTTSIAVYIKHISDRPKFIKGEVCVFANHVGSEIIWDERRFRDEDYCRAWKLEEGDINLLSSYGTRQGDNYRREAGAAVVFLDSKILCNCDIVDLPGFGTETQSDDDITFRTAQKADVIIYLSQANGFMRIEDINYLKGNIFSLPIFESNGENSLKPLSNLFVVASQANTVSGGNRDQIKSILDTGCKNLIKTLPPNCWANRIKKSGYDYPDNGLSILRSRFFAYTTDIPDICVQFNNALKEILEALPLIVNERAKKFVRDYVNARIPDISNEINKYEGIVAEHEKYASLLDEIDRNSDKLAKENDEHKQLVINIIKQLSNESVSEFSEYLASTINNDTLIAMIKEGKLKNKKEEIEQFGSFLQSTIQEKCEAILLEKSNILSREAEKYVTGFSQRVSSPFDEIGINADFDARWAFASALSTSGMIGGLVGTIGGAALVALTLSTAPILIGGIGLLLGPIGIAVGTLTLAGLAIAKLFGGGWEKTVAKNIVKTFEENKFGDKFREAIEKYWDGVESTFYTAAKKLDDEWDKYVNDLRNVVNNYDIADMQNRIMALRNLSDFFQNIPL